MKVFDSNTWKKHSNPWSGWTRILAFFLFPFPIWFQSWWWLAVLLLFFAINPFIFSEPKSNNNWMSHAILGEAQWTKHGIIQNDFPTILNLLNGLFFFLMIYGAWSHLPEITIFSTILSSVFKLWYLDRMTFSYKNSL